MLKRLEEESFNIKEMPQLRILLDVHAQTCYTDLTEMLRAASLTTPVEKAMRFSAFGTKLRVELKDRVASLARASAASVRLESVEKSFQQLKDEKKDWENVTFRGSVSKARGGCLCGDVVDYLTGVSGRLGGAEGL